MNYANLTTFWRTEQQLNLTDCRQENMSRKLRTIIIL
jgi:hypothetical protein